MLIQCDASMMTHMDLKQCPKCKVVKNGTEFYSYKYQCKKCHQSYQQNPEKRKVTSSKYYKKKKETNPALFMWKQAKHRAKWDYNNMEFTITVEDIKIPDKCPYFNREFIPLDKDWGYSLDRIDSSKGYTPDNIQVISYKANKAKNNLTEAELVEFAKGVLAVHQGGLAPC